MTSVECFLVALDLPFLGYEADKLENEAVRLLLV